MATCRYKSLIFRKTKDKIIGLLSILAVLLTIFFMVLIIYTVCEKGFKVIDWGFLTNISKPYGIPDSGIFNAILGSLFITLGAAVIAIPLGLFAGIFLAEYKEFTKLNNGLRFCANIMMNIPSIIIGLFVYTMLVVPRQTFSGVSASVALAVIMFPIIMRNTEDMLNMVPYSLREAALAVGMTKFRTTLKIVFTTARRGLITGILLSLSRVSGETAPLLFTAMFSNLMPTNYFSEPTANLPILITEYATNSPFESMHEMAWGASLVITGSILIINIVTKIVFKEKKNGN